MTCHHPDRTKAPEVKPFEGLRLPQVPERTLPGGAVLHTLGGAQQRVCRLTLMWCGGSYEAHTPLLVENTLAAMKEGTATLSGAEIAEITDYNGATLGHNVSDHHASIELSVLTDRMPYMLDLLHAIVTEPRIGEHTAAMLRTKAIATERLKRSKVSYDAGRASRLLVAGKSHPSSREVSETAIDSLTADVLQQYADTFAISGPAHVFLAGYIDDKVLDKVTSFVDSLAVTADRICNIEPFMASEPQTVRIDRPASLQTAVSVKFPAIRRDHPDYIPLRLAVMALGGYFGSRLMTNVRERNGYTYGISASLSGNLDGSYVSIDTQCDNAYTAAVLDEIATELGSLITRPVGDDELRRLKLFASSNLATTLDSPFNIMDMVQTRISVGTPVDYFEQQLRHINRLDGTIIAQMAGRYLRPDQMRVAIAGAL